MHNQDNGEIIICITQMNHVLKKSNKGRRGTYLNNMYSAFIKSTRVSSQAIKNRHEKS